MAPRMTCVPLSLLCSRSSTTGFGTRAYSKLSKLMPSASSIHSPCQFTWKPRSGMTALMRSTQILGTMSWKPHLHRGKV